MTSRRPEGIQNEQEPTFSPVDPLNEQEGTTLTEHEAPTVPRGKPKRRKVSTDSGTELLKAENPVPPEFLGGRPDRGRVKGRRGHLKQMTEMPLDTLHDIFRNLEPIDLLHLSWASRSLHGIVMEKAARYIWDGAFERLCTSENPLPRCPEDLNLAQYTRFIFGKKCMLCGTNNGYWVSWGLRFRVCWNCVGSSDRFISRDHWSSRLDHCLIYIRARNTKFCLKSDYQEMEDGEKLPPAERVVFFEQKAKLKQTKVEGAWAFEEWMRNHLYERLRLERKAAILKRLADIGWNETEIEKITGGDITGNLSSSTRAKKLTNSEWRELQPRIVMHLQGLKDVYLARKREVKLNDRWRVFSEQFELWEKDQTLEPSWRPCIADLAILEPFKSIIFTPSLEDGDFPLDRIDRVAQEWTRSRDDFVLSLLPQDIQAALRGRNGENKTLLQPLAFLQFFQGSSGPNTIVQICSNRSSFWDFPSCPNEDRGIYDILDYLKCPSRPWVWDSHYIKFSVQASELSKEVIRLFGLDRDTATLSQMQRCNKSFECLRCMGFLVYGRDWHGMVRHEIWGHLDDQPDTPLPTRWFEIAPEADYQSDLH
ncbi:hypothetical protein P691DRAFT_801422 [Macrolepiota fuliginosa MF-IS2]|uniref:F-box domain-containing protein n=1 Tax=Macrolepiota fuliginosa MF-IS2 TaxID=1400762 RepID=A0A9P6C132_9AGAR|nr:hypothetical protein P691DRAFT_801422 [Macrolepiota fuliginosa MF-IS2]